MCVVRCVDCSCVACVCTGIASNENPFSLTRAWIGLLSSGCATHSMHWSSNANTDTTTNTLANENLNLLLGAVADLVANISVLCVRVCVSRVRFVCAFCDFVLI
eukprot:c11296_g1_i1.p1 GENE.c11296_g1_i1~~c11296_g1_i1.p1  ORF type:complete len:104 (+),score=36.43 c11296_g1_i1:453-764(+)